MKLNMLSSVVLVYLLVVEGSVIVAASSAAAAAAANLRRIRLPVNHRLSVETSNGGKLSNTADGRREEIETTDDFEAIEPDMLDFPSTFKRMSDDYGHMRFGKRNSFDDYGHMRFGKRNKDNEDEDYGHLRFGR